MTHNSKQHPFRGAAHGRQELRAWVMINAALCLTIAVGSVLLPLSSLITEGHDNQAARQLHTVSRAFAGAWIVFGPLAVASFACFLALKRSKRSTLSATRLIALACFLGMALWLRVVWTRLANDVNVDNDTLLVVVLGNAGWMFLLPTAVLTKSRKLKVR